MTPGRLLKAKICLVGEAAVGKTSLIRRYVLDQFDDSYLMTLQAKVSKKVIEVPIPPAGTLASVEMAVWDIMGQQRFRELLTESYFQGVSGLLAVADLTRRQTFKALYEWIDRVDSVTSQAPIVVVANKADLSKAAQLTEADVAQLAQAVHADYMLTSAKTGENVEAVFRLLGGRIAERSLNAPHVA